MCCSACMSCVCKPPVLRLKTITPSTMRSSVTKKLLDDLIKQRMAITSHFVKDRQAPVRASSVLASTVINS